MPGPQSTSPNDPSGELLTIEEAAIRLRIGRTTMYSLVKSGEVESVSIGRLRRIPAECVADYVRTLRQTQNASPHLTTIAA